jgi:hypothetical protein
LEEKQENLCVKILQTLKEMLAVDTEYGEKVHCKALLFLLLWAAAGPAERSGL